MKNFNWRKAPTESTFRIKNETERIRSSALTDIQRDTRRLWKKIVSLLYRGGIARTEQGAARIVRGHIEKVSSNPVFTHSEEAGLKGYIWNMILISFYIASEALLYFLISSTYVPGSSPILRSVLALFLSMLGVKGIYLGYSTRFSYLRALSVKDALTEYELTEYREKYHWGRVIGVLSLVGIIAAGMARIYFLESGVIADGLTPERLHSVIMAGRATSVFTMVVGVTCAMILATQKHEQAALGVLFVRRNKWRRATAKQDRCNEILGALAISMRSIIERRIERAWQELVTAKASLGAPDEHDAKYAQLSVEYEVLKASLGFAVTDAVYNRFSAIASTCEQLFKHGLYSAPGIQEKIALANKILRDIDKGVDERTPDFMKQSEAKPANPDIQWSKNGHSVAKGVVAALMPCLLSMGSCTVHQKSVPVEVLIDLSGSRDTAVVQWYRTLTSTSVFPALGQKSSITVHPIDYASQTFDQEIYSKDFSANVYENEYAGLKQEAIAERSHQDSVRCATSNFENAFNVAYTARKQYRRGTDILGALSHVSSNLHDSGVLIIMSDMLQETDSVHVNLEKQRCKLADYPRLLQLMGHTDLHGIRVIIITGEQTAMSPERYDAIRGLWLQYFSANGAKVVSYNSGTSTSIHNELKNK